MVLMPYAASAAPAQPICLLDHKILCDLIAECVDPEQTVLRAQEPFWHDAFHMNKKRLSTFLVLQKNSHGRGFVIVLHNLF